MNEKLNDAEDDNTPRACERADELVTYLYGESGPQETALFRQHLSECAVCRDESADFGDVRQAVAAWRAEALSLPHSFATNQTVPPSFSAGESPVRKRLALAALREFFSLSPLWMQTGALAAMLLICTMAALTFARTEIRWDSHGLAFQTGVGNRVIEKERLVEKQVPAPDRYTAEQVNALVDEGVSHQLAIERVRWQKEQDVKVAAVLASATAKKTGPRTMLIAGNLSRRQDRPSPVARQMRGNQFSVAENISDEALPRLTDLLGEVKEGN